MSQQLLRKLFSVIMGLCVCLCIHAQISHTYHFNQADFEIVTNEDDSAFIRANDILKYDNVPDQVCLPVRNFSYGLPFGMKVKSATILAGDRKLLRENIHLEMTTEGLPVGTLTAASADGNINTPTEASNYEWNKFLGNRDWRGIAIATFRLCPFVYDENSHNLYFVRDFRIKVDLELYESDSKLPDDLAEFENDVMRMVDNPDDVHTYVTQLSKMKQLEDIPYSQLFTEGKEWKWYHYAAQPASGTTVYTNHYIVNVKVDGSKVIDGIECKRLTIDTQASHNSCSQCDSWLNRDFINLEKADEYGFRLGIPKEVYVYEKDRRIYFYRDPGIMLNAKGDDVVECEPYFDLLVDLNFTEGDEIHGIGMIEYDDVIYPDGKPHRRIAHSMAVKDSMNPPAWIEGIGLTMGLCVNQPMFKYYGLLPTEISSPGYLLGEVRENGKIIFEQTEMLKAMGLLAPNEEASVESIPQSQLDTHNCYDLLGRPVSSPSSGELFIRNHKINVNR